MLLWLLVLFFNINAIFNESLPVFRSCDEYQEAPVSYTLSLADLAAVAFVSHILLIVLLWLMLLMFC